MKDVETVRVVVKILVRPIVADVFGEKNHAHGAIAAAYAAAKHVYEHAEIKKFT